MAPAQLRPALLSCLLSGAAALSSSIAAPRAAASWRSADWSSCFRSATECRDRVDLDVLRGAVPPALEGTVYKVGPGRFEAGDEPFAHWLDGDGFAFAVEFRGGAASFVARFVETAGFADEARAGAVVWRTTFGTNRRGGPLANAFDLRLKNPANTAMLPLPGRGVVLALWEAGPPRGRNPRCSTRLRYARRASTYVPKRTRRENPIRPRIGRNDFDVTESARFEVLPDRAELNGRFRV